MGENPLLPKSAVFKVDPLAASWDGRAGKTCGLQAREVGM